MLNFDTYGNNLQATSVVQGSTYRVLAPVQEVNTNNLSHIEEVYQNLPQLNRALLPSTHSYMPPTQLSHDNFRLQQNRPYEYHSPEFKPAVSPIHLNYPNPSRNHRRKLAETGDMSKRNGWGWDAGHGHGDGHGKKDESPALSALALLGFMFFLNLIQTSLQNNRQLLAAKALNATTIGGLGIGRNGGFARLRRDIPPYSFEDVSSYGKSSENSTVNYLSSDGTKPHKSIKFIPLQNHVITSSSPHPIRKPKRRTSSKFMSSNHIHFVKPKDPVSFEASTEKPMKEDPVENFKSFSIQCFQLVACKLGKSIYDSLDGATGTVVRMLGTSLIPKIPRKTWTGRLMRAFNKGWNREEICENSFRKCEALSKLFDFYHANSQVMKRKSF